ncbi:YifB family Mg chelatase-like AAA ATPase [Sphaerisporangium sp. NPDC049003]|uniref:YifB family Mg chelatase-like AAA ATPase n=1 Tax=Sphaerisporangium sp. NPDC049003 TaxID=3364517 RepID=UPI003713BA07
MADARVHAAIVIGVTGHLIQVEADVTDGLPALLLAGLPERGTWETRDRVRAAFLNSGLAWPESRATVNVLPAELPKGGTAADLAIAVALLAAAGAIPDSGLGRWVFLGELGLDGAVRPVQGVLPMIHAAVAAGIPRAVIPAANAGEASQIPGAMVVPVRDLAQLAGWLRNGELEERGRSSPLVGRCSPASPVDLADVIGNAAARRALEVAAAGGHHLFLQGPSGSPATMLAERLPTILPPLNDEASREVSEIYSAAGDLYADRFVPGRPPLVSPHHTSTQAAIFGARRPGAVSLAHRGVLYLDDAAEFPAVILHGLRRPLEAGEVVVARGDWTIRYPARFTLVLASPPCPCGAVACVCTPLARRRHLARLAGLLDRVEIRTRVVRLNRPGLLGDSPGESSAAVAERVAAARERASARLTGTPWRTNAEVPLLELRTVFRTVAGALDPLDRALNTGALTVRSYAQVLRVAWTIADLGATDTPGRDEIQEALALWKGESPGPDGLPAR